MNEGFEHRVDKKIEDIEPGEKVWWMSEVREITKKTRETNESDGREYVLLYYDDDLAICDLPFCVLEVVKRTYYTTGSYAWLLWRNKRRQGRVVAISEDGDEALLKMTYTCYPGRRGEYTETMYFALDNKLRKPERRVAPGSDYRRLRKYKPEKLPKKWQALLD